MSTENIALSNLNPEWQEEHIRVTLLANRISIAGAVLALCALASGLLLSHLGLIASGLALIPVLLFRSFIRSMAYAFYRLSIRVAHMRVPNSAR